jgi:hypothetical protein
MHYPKDLDPVRDREIEHDHAFKAGNPESTQDSKAGMFKIRMPSHFWLCGQQTERLMCCKKEAMTDFWAGRNGQIISLIIQILVSLRTMT